MISARPRADERIQPSGCPTKVSHLARPLRDPDPSNTNMCDRRRKVHPAVGALYMVTRSSPLRTFTPRSGLITMFPSASQYRRRISRAMGIHSRNWRMRVS